VTRTISDDDDGSAQADGNAAAHNDVLNVLQNERNEVVAREEEEEKWK
jgi:hypothetical protein